nr:hypothetical protein [Tanacetum cinerariifolium]
MNEDVVTGALTPSDNSRNSGLASDGRLVNNLDVTVLGQSSENRFFISLYIKAANPNIGAVRAHNLYIGLKVSSSVHEHRQEFTKDFSFDYFVEDAELCGLFLADEVAKCNYKEFGDILSFDATYKTN